jgi:hypothetical protein
MESFDVKNWILPTLWFYADMINGFFMFRSQMAFIWLMAAEAIALRAMAALECSVRYKMLASTNTEIMRGFRDEQLTIWAKNELPFA